MTIIAISGWFNEKADRIGAIILAAVIMATVADPCVILNNADNNHASTIKGMVELANESARVFPIPLSTSICFKTPPAPVTRIMIPAGPSALVLSSSIACRDNFLLIHNRIARIVAIIRAVKGWPMKIRISVIILSLRELLLIPIPKGADYNQE